MSNDIYLSTQNNLRPLDGSVVSRDTWDTRRSTAGRVLLGTGIAAVVVVSLLLATL